MAEFADVTDERGRQTALTMALGQVECWHTATHDVPCRLCKATL